MKGDQYLIFYHGAYKSWKKEKVFFEQTWLSFLNLNPTISTDLSRRKEARLPNKTFSEDLLPRWEGL